MANGAYLDPSKRHDAVLLFDVQDGNPNGDPDAGNLPRVDPETLQGLVTDVAIKRKVRNFVDFAVGTEDSYNGFKQHSRIPLGAASRYKIYVQDKGVALNDLHQRAYTDLELTSTGTKQKREDVNKARAWMCQNFYDVRSFGAVMSTEVNAGQVRGPLQLTFSRSIDPIVPLDISITRVAITDPKDVEIVVSEGGRGKGGKVTEMGRKALIAYGLYKGNIFYSPQQAQDTGFDDADLALFWDALERMWDFDRSASRGMMACRGIIIFSHDNPYGNAPAHRLIDRVTVSLKDGVAAARSFSDYTVSIEGDNLPDGVTLTHLGA